MHKIILIIGLSFLTSLVTMAQTPKIAFIDWDSIRNQVNLYKMNYTEIANFKKLLEEEDSFKVVHFQFLLDSARWFNHYAGSDINPFQKRLEKEELDLEAFESSISKIVAEFEKQLKSWTDNFVGIKIRDYGHFNDFKSIYGLNKLLFNQDNFNEKLIELINKDENAKEASTNFIKFLNDKIKADYNLN